MTLDDEVLVWERTYDRESVERFLAEAQAERSRLRAEIDDARRRLAAAEAREATASQDDESRLAALVVATHREIAEARRDNELAIEALLAAAESEAAEILAMAQREVARRGSQRPSGAPVRAEQDPSEGHSPFI